MEIETKNIITAIKSVLNENLVNAKNEIYEKLNEKLSLAMGDKFEEFAPAIFESSHKKSKKKKDSGKRWQDSDVDGKWYEPGDDVKAVNEETYCEDGNCEDMEKGENEDEETESKKSSGSKKEKESEDEEGTEESENEEEKED